MVTKTTDLDDLPFTLVGVAGEYFVAAELSRRGYVASITLRNTRGIDILVTNPDASRSAGVQVKTNSGKKKDWMLNEKAEKYFSDTLFYIFVNLNGHSQPPDYHIVPSKVVANYIKKSHRKWLARPNRAGKPHKDTPMRHFKDEKNQYLNRWDLLWL